MLPAKWSPYEIAFLESNYGNIPTADIASCLGRPRGGVASKAKSLRLTSPKSGDGNDRWRQEEEDFLRQWYGSLPTQEIASRLSRSIIAVSGKAIRMELANPSPYARPKKKWSAEEEDFIRKNCSEKTNEEIAADLGRTKGSIHNRMQRLKIQPKLRVWSAEEDAFIRQSFFTHTAAEIATHLERSVGSVYRRSSELGFRRRADNWSAGEDLLLMDLCKTMRIGEIELRLERSRGAIGFRCQKLGIKPQPTPDEVRVRKVIESRALPTIEYAARSGWPTDLTNCHVRILNCLAAIGVPTSVNDIAQAIHAASPTVCSFARNLYCRELLARIRDPYNHHRFLYMLGPLALTILEDAVKCRSQSRIES